MHEHTYMTQRLRHEHPGGTEPHGYFGHEEDKGGPAYGAGTYEYLGPVDPDFKAPLADALADVDRVQNEKWPARGAELSALRNLAEQVRLHLMKRPEHAAGLAAGFTAHELDALVTSAAEMWEHTDAAVDYLNAGQQAVLDKARTVVYEDWGVTP